MLQISIFLFLCFALILVGIIRIVFASTLKVKHNSLYFYFEVILSTIVSMWVFSNVGNNFGELNSFNIGSYIVSFNIFTILYFGFNFIYMYVVTNNIKNTSLPEETDERKKEEEYRSIIFSLRFAITFIYAIFVVVGIYNYIALPDIGDELTFSQIKELDEKTLLVNYSLFDKDFIDKFDGRYYDGVTFADEDLLTLLVDDNQKFIVKRRFLYLFGTTGLEFTPANDRFGLLTSDKINFMGENYDEFINFSPNFKSPKIKQHNGYEHLSRIAFYSKDEYEKAIIDYDFMKADVYEYDGNFNDIDDASRLVQRLNTISAKRFDFSYKGRETLYLVDFYGNADTVNSIADKRKMIFQLKYFGDNQKAVFIDVETNELLDLTINNSDYEKLNDGDTVYVSFVNNETLIGLSLNDLSNKINNYVLEHEDRIKTVISNTFTSKEGNFLNSKSNK